MFVLSSQNIASYLNSRNISLTIGEKEQNISLKQGKNFNLLVRAGENNYILVKQERLSGGKTTSQEFIYEWRIQEWLNSDPTLESLRHLMPKVIDFDRDNAIMTIEYYNDCQDLSDFYSDRQLFPENIAAAVGSSIAEIHRRTFNSTVDRQFLQIKSISDLDYPFAIDKLSPQIFGVFCNDGIDFFRLYQRYDSLKQALIQLKDIWHPCCLIHHDLKLDNILFRLQSQASNGNLICLIDWEKYRWGDPAYDIATIIESYLKIWLKSLLVSPTIDINTSLQLASTPLEKLQPSLLALITSYLTSFPQILEDNSNFFPRLMQLTGYIAINKIVQKLESHSPFDNRSICTLQVAKTLLCRPQDAVAFVFGKTETAIIDRTFSSKYKVARSFYSR